MALALDAVKRKELGKKARHERQSTFYLNKNQKKKMAQRRRAFNGPVKYKREKRREPNAAMKKNKRERAREREVQVRVAL